MSNFTTLSVRPDTRERLREHQDGRSVEATLTRLLELKESVEEAN